MTYNEASVIRVLIVEDHVIVREGLVALLERQPRVSVLADTGDGEEALRLIEEHAPEVVLLDLKLNGSPIEGLDLLDAILRTSPTSYVLVLSAYSEDELVFPSLMRGAIGYVLKQSGLDEVLEAIFDAAAGKHHLDPLIIKRIIEHMKIGDDKSPEFTPVEKLTRREREILPMLTRGLTNIEIAEQLTISRATIKTHVSNILRKLGVPSRNQILYGIAKQSEKPLG